MKYSIIIPHLNEWFYLNAMFDSFYIRNTFQDFEIIVVDDGSTNVHDLDFISLHPLTQKTRILFEKNLWSARARNLWAQEAKWKYLIFLDAHMYIGDDILSQINSIENEYDCMQMVVWNYINKSNKWLIYKINDLALNSGWMHPSDDLILTENPCSSGAATIIRTSVFNDVWWFNPNIRKWGTEDLELSMRLWLRGYTCLLNNNITIAHYYKQKFENTVISSEDVIFNKIMFNYLCFQNIKRQNIIFDAMKISYGAELFDKALAKYNEDTEAHKWIENQQKKFIYNDDWYIDHFKWYYPNFLINTHITVIRI